LKSYAAGRAARGTGHAFDEAHALRGIGAARVRRRESGQAREALQHALELADRVGQRTAQMRALLGLSEVALAGGDPGEAILFGQRAADAFREIRMPLDEARALTLLGRAYAAAGDGAAAHKASEAAAALRAAAFGDRDQRVS
jgi:tetratricopeptide (TPR) repeat protein